ncbi:MAG TPA: hypothetical protein VHZ55_05490, partial [Bryobacteraceae bacterium]|nr:hypothetical protein [Bryobacteraceae bacterium]
MVLLPRPALRGWLIGTAQSLIRRGLLKNRVGVVITLNSYLFLNRLNRKVRNSLFASYRPYPRPIRQSLLSAAALGLFFLQLPAVLVAQSVPPALESPAAGPPQTGPQGQKLIGMPKFHEPAPYDFDEHTG